MRRKTGNCPFSSDEEHYSTESEARQAYEKNNADKIPNGLKKTLNRNKTLSVKEVYAKRSKIYQNYSKLTNEEKKALVDLIVLDKNSDSESAAISSLNIFADNNTPDEVKQLLVDRLTDENKRAIASYIIDTSQHSLNDVLPTPWAEKIVENTKNEKVAKLAYLSKNVPMTTKLRIVGESQSEFSRLAYAQLGYERNFDLSNPDDKAIYDGQVTLLSNSDHSIATRSFDFLISRLDDPKAIAHVYNNFNHAR